MHVVIVGGGIVGCACAYYLCKRGFEVTVIEQGHLGYGSSPRASGGIRAQFSTPVSIALSQMSIDVWKRFPDEFNAEISYRQNGYLYLTADQETARSLEQRVSFHNDHGVPSEYVDPSRIPSYCDRILADQYVGGTYCPTDGYADPTRALHGFAVGAARTGATMRLGERVIGIEQTNTGVMTVRTTRDQLQADIVVNAAGAWANDIASLVDVDLPITPVRRQLLILRPSQPLDPTSPLITDLDRGIYVRPRSEQTLFAGGHVEDATTAVAPDSFARSYDASWAAHIKGKLENIVRGIGPESSIERGWAGLYAMTPDHHPIIDEIAPGVITVAGFSGHGFMHAPATGQLVAELIADGDTSSTDISALAADRFETGDTLSETFYSA